MPGSIANTTDPPETTQPLKSPAWRQTYTTYRDYLDQNAPYWPELQWMQAFMQSPDGDPESTKVTILDARDGSFTSTEIPPVASEALQHAIETRQPEVITRLIIVTYRTVYGLNRSVVDVLGSYFDIDAMVLQQHLLSGKSCSEIRLGPTDAQVNNYLALLPSEQQRPSSGIHFGLTFEKYVSVLFVGAESRTSSADNTSE